MANDGHLLEALLTICCLFVDFPEIAGIDYLEFRIDCKSSFFSIQHATHPIQNQLFVSHFNPFYALMMLHCAALNRPNPCCAFALQISTLVCILLLRSGMSLLISFHINI